MAKDIQLSDPATEMAQASPRTVSALTHGPETIWVRGKQVVFVVVKQAGCWRNAEAGGHYCWVEVGSKIARSALFWKTARTAPGRTLKPRDGLDSPLDEVRDFGGLYRASWVRQLESKIFVPTFARWMRVPRLDGG